MAKFQDIRVQIGGSADCNRMWSDPTDNTVVGMWPFQGLDTLGTMWPAISVNNRQWPFCVSFETPFDTCIVNIGVIDLISTPQLNINLVQDKEIDVDLIFEGSLSTSLKSLVDIDINLIQDVSKSVNLDFNKILDVELQFNSQIAVDLNGETTLDIDLISNKTTEADLEYNIVIDIDLIYNKEFTVNICGD